MKTSYDFVLPRGYVDHRGRLHREGRMRLATARDELEPLRDPTVSGPDDPRLTILVLTRVIEQLGEVELLTSHDIEGLFAVDLAFLQDFYGVINFGTQEEYEALLQAQQESSLVGGAEPETKAAVADRSDASDAPAAPAGSGGSSSASSGEQPEAPERPTLRTAVEELPRRAL